jgi:hypothetical protein
VPLEATTVQALLELGPRFAVPLEV